MLEQAFLRRLVVVRRHRQQAVDTDALQLTRQLNDLARVIAARPGQHGHTAGHLVHDELDDPELLPGAQRRRLAGSAAGRDEVDARVDLPLHQPTHGGLVYRAILSEWRDERRTNTREASTHGHDPLRTSSIVNQPRRPCTQRAASSAPAAKPRRSRAVWVSSIVSDAPSNPIVCVPGIAPARVDDTSMGLAYPAAVIASRSSSAVPDGASRFVA